MNGRQYEDSRKLAHRTFIEKDLQTQATSELGVTATKLNSYLTTLGRTAGPPWRSDQRSASIAAQLILMRLCTQNFD